MAIKTSKSIAMLEPSGFGGVCHYTYNLCSSLARLGNKIAVLSCENNEVDGLSRTFDYIPIFHMNEKYLEKVYKLSQYLVYKKINIIHIQGLFSARRDVFLFPLFKLLPIKTVYTVHNILPHDKEERKAKGMKQAFQSIYNSADKLIVHSNRDKNKIVSELKININKINVIPIGNYDFIFNLKSKNFNNDKIREKYGVNNETKLVLIFGALRPYKGIHRFLKAMAAVCPKSVVVLIVGKRMERNETYPNYLRKLIINEHMEKKAYIVEKYIPFNKVSDYFLAADVVAFPYEHIYDSGVLRLALSSKKPAIATNVGIFQDYVVNKLGGILVDNTMEGLISSVVQIEKLSRLELKSMGVWASNNAKKNLNWDTIASKTMKVYAQLLYQ
jgi:glycosyltransferase involved in cell wall biosynthesis